MAILLVGGWLAGGACDAAWAQPPTRPAASADRGLSFLSEEERNVLKADVYFNLARQANESQQHDEALANLGCITRLRFPSDPQAQHLLGGSYLMIAEIHLQSRRPVEARKSAMEAISRCGKQPCLVVAEAYKVLARIALMQGKKKESREYLHRSMKVLDGLTR